MSFYEINEICEKGVCYRTCADKIAKGIPNSKYSAAQVVQAAKLALGKAR